MDPSSVPPVDSSSVPPVSAESQDLPSSPVSSKGLPPPEDIVDLEAEKGVPEGVPSKKKKDKKEKSAKDKEPQT